MLDCTQRLPKTELLEGDDITKKIKQGKRSQKILSEAQKLLKTLIGSCPFHCHIFFCCCPTVVESGCWLSMARKISCNFRLIVF